MVKKYVLVRMPIQVYQKYKDVKMKMETDISRFYGRRIPMTMPKVFKAVIDPKFNENFIEVDLKKLTGLAKNRRYEIE